MEDINCIEMSKVLHWQHLRHFYEVIISIFWGIGVHEDKAVSMGGPRNQSNDIQEYFFDVGGLLGANDDKEVYLFFDV